MPTGGDRLVRELAGLGLTHVFALPGTQTVALFDALRRGRLRTVLATNEMNAAFMATGFFRASGRPAVLATIPGPGFTHAMSGLVEARHDSSALLHLVGPPSAGPGERFRLQAIDQHSIARLTTKGVFDVTDETSLEETVRAAWNCAVSGEPGPVVLHVGSSILARVASHSPHRAELESRPPVPPEDLAAAGDMLARARRPVLLLGQGALDAQGDVQHLASTLGAPVITSCSARGLLPEDHALALRFDVTASSTTALNALLESSDCILVLGYKLSHNGTAGFRMRIPAGTLLHVDAGEGVLGANYEPAIALATDAGMASLYFSERLTDAGGSTWSLEEIARWRLRLTHRPDDETPEPRVHRASPPSGAGFLAVLREALPRDAIVVTDSGLHQIMVRRHYPVLSPRGLIVPSDYQSMGFGIPAAIGAKMAAPDRPVVAVVGDGGFAMSGMEALTAVRERVALTIIVFNDGHLNLIRLQQYGSSGRSNAVALHNPDFEMLACAIGAEYRRFEGESSITDIGARDRRGVTIVEVRLGDSVAMWTHQATGSMRASVRRAAGPRVMEGLKRLIRRS